MTTRMSIAPALTALAAVVAAAAFVAGSTATPVEAAPPASKNIVQTAAAAGQFRTLVALVKKAGVEAQSLAAQFGQAELARAIGAELEKLK